MEKKGDIQGSGPSQRLMGVLSPRGGGYLKRPVHSDLSYQSNQSHHFTVLYTSLVLLMRVMSSVLFSSDSARSAPLAFSVPVVLVVIVVVVVLQIPARESVLAFDMALAPTRALVDVLRSSPAGARLLAGVLAFFRPLRSLVSSLRKEEGEGRGERDEKEEKREREEDEGRMWMAARTSDAKASNADELKGVRFTRSREEIQREEKKR